ncbi:MAG: ECF-type sigma factor [Pirellulaceae bacterium]
MTEVTRILSAIDRGDPQAAGELLPLVYDELRRLAAQKLAHEKPGQTLQATALVHEAYIRLVGSEDQKWDSRGHFFAAAAEAMRRILVENARRRTSTKRSGGLQRKDLRDSQISSDKESAKLIALHEALDELAEVDPSAAELVKVRYFAGLTIPQAAKVLGVSPRKADFLWSYARAWLRREIEGD